MEKGQEFHLDVVSVRLVKDAPVYSEKKINTPQDAVLLMGDILKDMDREVVCLISLKADNTPINCHFASVGTLNYAVVHPRELLKAAILSNAAGMLLVHNHISGSLMPSRDDVMLTERLKKAADLVGIPLIDHVIVGGDNSRYFSFQEKGMVDHKPASYQEDYHKLEWAQKSQAAEKGRCR